MTIIDLIISKPKASTEVFLAQLIMLLTRVWRLSVIGCQLSVKDSMKKKRPRRKTSRTILRLFLLSITHHLEGKAKVFSLFSLNVLDNLSYKFHMCASWGKYSNETDWKLGRVRIMLQTLCCWFRLKTWITSIMVYGGTTCDVPCWWGGVTFQHNFVFKKRWKLTAKK